MRKIEEHEGEKYLIVDNCMVDKSLDKIKEIIGIEKFDDTKIWINTNDKLSDNIILTLHKVVILLTEVIKEGDRFYPQVFLDHALYDE